MCWNHDYLHRYKEFYLKHLEEAARSDRIPNFIKRLAALDFWDEGPVAVRHNLIFVVAVTNIGLRVRFLPQLSFFAAVLCRQNSETLSAWVKQFAQDLRENDRFRSSFMVILRLACSQECEQCIREVMALLPEDKYVEEEKALSSCPLGEVTKPLQEALETRT